MSSESHIHQRASLAHYHQLAGAIWQLLQPAIAAGLTEERAGAIYKDLMHHYDKLDGAAFFPLQEKVVHFLTLPDEKLIRN